MELEFSEYELKRLKLDQKIENAPQSVNLLEDLPEKWDVKVIPNRDGSYFVRKCIGGNTSCQIKKLSATEYLHLSTGEIRQFVKKANKTNQKSIENSQRYLKRLVATNPCRHILYFTLTYTAPPQGDRKITNDFAYFFRKIKAYCLKNFNSEADYIAVPELHADLKTLHFHGLLYVWSAQKAPFIPCAEFEKMWGHGSTSVKTCKRRDSLENYLLPRLNASENEKAKHMNEKAKRIFAMPCDLKMVRHSRGIRLPQTVKMTVEEAKELTKGMTRKSIPPYFKTLTVHSKWGVKRSVKITVRFFSEIYR